jgi:hypothetical protein
MTKTLYRFFILFLFIGALVPAANAQVLTRLQAQLKTEQQQSFSEKLFVHTDKDVYLTGELLWFKVYYNAAAKSSAKHSSKVAYVDVLDRNNNSLLQAKIALNGKGGDGSFYIPVSSLTGTYTLRAYTSWMKNAGGSFLFEKQVTIINPLLEPERTTPAKQDYALHFFPEGGDLVEGLQSKVAFKVTAGTGRSLAVKGAVVNQRNETVAEFVTHKHGIGQFNFTPRAGDSYKAVATTPGKDVVIGTLPEVRKEGYVVSVKESADGRVAVNVNTNVNTDVAYLIVHNRSGVMVAERIPLSDHTGNFSVDKSKLGDGVSNFTIFNNTGKAVCERLYFKRPVDQLTVDASTSAISYRTRQQVKLSLGSKMQTGKSLAADFSIAIRRLDSLQGDKQGNILSYLWLGSELKGTVESPDYYFSANNEETNVALDLLMLTHGWRRFKQNASGNDQVSAIKAIKNLPELEGHLITGRVRAADGSPAKNVLIHMGVTGKRTQYYGSKSDSTGRIIFNTKDFYGQNEVVFQANNEADSTLRIEIESPFLTEYSPKTAVGFSYTPAMLNALQLRSLNVQVQNIYAGNRLRQFYKPEVDSAAFYNKPYKTYLLEDYTRFKTMEEVMREYVREVDVVRRQQRFHIKMVNGLRYLDGDPLVLLDGVPVLDMDRVMKIDPLKVKKLELVRDQYFWGQTVSQGIMNFTTYDGNLGGAEIDPHAVVLDYEGMQLQREFYAPVYETEAQKASRLPDFRTLLYWSPNVSTDASGKGELSFYTSDQPGEYIGEIQGMTADGTPGVGYVRFEVRK